MLLPINLKFLLAENDSTFKADGKVLIHLINRTMYQTEGIQSRYGMYINRAYLGYEYKFHPQWSASIVVDAGRPTIFGNLDVTDSSGIRHNAEYDYNEGSYHTMILKFAYIEFCPNSQLVVDAGSIKQIHYCIQENYWGYRYIYETLTDKFFGIPTADLGISASYKVFNFLDIDGIVSNGTGYKQIADEQGRVKIGVGISLKPLEGIILRAYYDNIHAGDSLKTGNQQLISLFTGYRKKDCFRIGIEYDIHKNHDFYMDKNLYGYSIFGSYTIADNLETFARFDNISSNILSGNAAWHQAFDGNAYIAGLHFAPVKGFSCSLSYQGWEPANKSADLINSAVFCFEFKL